MIKYTWDIISLTKRDYPEVKDVVVQVNWIRTGTDEHGNSFDYQCESPVPPPADLSNFKDLDDLTEEEVIEWVVSGLDPEAIRNMDAFIADKLAAVNSTTTVVPWVKKPTKKAKKKGK
jgi:hypothetical protein